MTRTVAAIALGVLAVTGCQMQESGQDAAPEEPSRQQAAEEIRQLDQRWVEMVQADDTVGIVDLYVDGAGRIMPPGGPSMVGHEALRQFWAAALDFPSLTFGPDTVVVSGSGDMAADIGTARFRPEEGAPEVEGKYVVVWIRQGGEWKVLADIFNTNQPPPGE